MITNDDILDEFLSHCKTSSKKEILKKWGGSAIYIPSYKGYSRNDDIKDRFDELINKGNDRSVSARICANEFNLSVVRIYEILRKNGD